jgi:hypothetical protein
LQTVDAWQGSTRLPSSTGQVTALDECKAIVAANLSSAPSFGYAADARTGTITDPESKVTIKQGCVEALPFFEPYPKHPYAGAAPKMSSVPWSIGPCTEVILTLGQSNGGNYGRGRYTAGPNTWAYAGNGSFYQASDPMMGQEGTDASPWPRLADMLIGQKHASAECPAAIDGVIIAARNFGGAFISSLAPGGDLHPVIVSSIRDMLAHGLQPTRILWHQGEAEATTTIKWSQLAATSQAYRKSFLSLLKAVRQLGLKAPVYVATTTICNSRTSAYPFAHEMLWRDPAYYIETEIARIAIRNAQKELASASDLDIHPGPNTDEIDWRYRAAGDGCHGDERFLTEHAKGWATALTGIRF